MDDQHKNLTNLTTEDYKYLGRFGLKLVLVVFLLYLFRYPLWWIFALCVWFVVASLFGGDAVRPVLEFLQPINPHTW